MSWMTQHSPTQVFTPSSTRGAQCLTCTGTSWWSRGSSVRRRQGRSSQPTWPDSTRTSSQWTPINLSGGHQYISYHRGSSKTIENRELTVCFRSNLSGSWSSMSEPGSEISTWDTGLGAEVLKWVGAQSVKVPESFNVHSHLKKHHIEARIKKLEAGSGLDWGTAEALAIGSLLYQVQDFCQSNFKIWGNIDL